MSFKYDQSWFWSIRLAAIDLLTFWGCCVIAIALRQYTFAYIHFAWVDVALITSTCLIGLSIVGGYEAKRDMSTLRYASEHVLAMVAVLFIILIETYVFSTFNETIKPGRFMLVFGLVLFTPLALSYRYLFSLRVRRDAAKRFVYVIGPRALTVSLKTMCRRARFRHPLRMIECKASTEEGRAMEYRTTQEMLSNEMESCEGVVIDLSRGKPPAEFQQFLLNLNLHQVPVYPVDAFVEAYFYKINLDHVTLSWALDGTFKADHHSAYGNLKTLLDIIVAAGILILLLPVLLVIALAIKLTGSGPILFKQVRVGRFERPFTLYKFRTMNMVAEENASLYTLKNDQRITRVGQVLRRTRVDELPQLWNVIKGDMSLIGPRAEWDKLVERYKKEIPFYHLRYMVKPGITGWAQVNYRYGADLRDSFEKLQYDLYYIKHYSPQMDASIILKTLFTILSASGR